MAAKTGLVKPRTVQCYLCQHRFEVGRRAQSTACPKCSKAVMVADIIVKQLKPVTEVKTCGKLIIQRKGRVIAKRIIAHQGVEVMGVLDASVQSGGLVVIGAKAQWRGDCHAPRVMVKSGARVTGHFVVPDDQMGLDDLSD